MRRRTRLTVGISTAAVALTLAACSSTPSTPSTTAAEANFVTDGTFSWSVADDPGALNPLSGSRTVAVNLYRFLYDPLVHSDPTGKIVSGIADQWTVDGAKVTFHIKSDVTCSDGSAVTPDIVKRAFDLAKDPTQKSTLIGIALPNGNYTTASDDAASTFTLTLDAPYQFILPALEFFPIPCGDAGANPVALTDTASGSGPYTLTTASTGDQYVLTRRDGYTWGPDGATTAAAGVPKTLVMKIVSSESTAANLLTSGELNAAAINGPDRDRLTAAGMQATSYVSGGNVMLFNQQDGRITADPAVRKAIVQALDFDQIAAVVTQGLDTSASHSLAPASPQACVDDDAASAVPSTDVDASKKLLADAGWVAGADGVLVKDGKQLVLDAPFLSTYAGNQPALELEAQMLAAVGIKLNLVPITQANLSSTVFSTGDYDVWPVLALSVPFQSGLFGLLAGPFPPNGTNAGHVANADFTRLATLGNQNVGETGCGYWVQAEQALFSNADAEPVAPVITNWVTSHATFNTMQGRLIPTSIRLTN